LKKRQDLTGSSSTVTEKVWQEQKCNYFYFTIFQIPLQGKCYLSKHKVFLNGGKEAEVRGNTFGLCFL